MQNFKDPVQEFINRVHNSGQGAPKNAIKNGLKLKVGDKVRQKGSTDPTDVGKIVEVKGSWYNVDWGAGVYTDEDDASVYKNAASERSSAMKNG